MTEEKENNQRFSVSFDSPSLVWSSTMDLLGVFSCSDHALELHRVGYKHQKVFAKEDLVGPTAMTFTDNGKYVVVGYEDGKISVLSSDNAEEIFSVKIVDFGSAITAFHW